MTEKKKEYLVWAEHCFHVEADSAEEAENEAKLGMSLWLIDSRDLEEFSFNVAEY